MSDLAQHRQEDFETVWGTNPLCIKCKKRKADDAHHVRKRGNPKDKHDRKMHSSILGCAPLCRCECHKGKLHDFDTEQELLLAIKERVDMSPYVYRELDHEFKDKYSRYYSPSPKNV